MFNTTLGRAMCVSVYNYDSILQSTTHYNAYIRPLHIPSSRKFRETFTQIHLFSIVSQNGRKKSSQRISMTTSTMAPDQETHLPSGREKKRYFSISTLFGITYWSRKITICQTWFEKPNKKTQELRVWHIKIFQNIKSHKFHNLLALHCCVLLFSQSSTK